jgi:hypothetical protein
VDESKQPSLPVVIRSAAAAEIATAYRWYERERFGLGEEFLEAVKTISQRISVIFVSSLA